MNRSIFLTVLLIFIVTVHSFSQYYETGQDPASIKWKQINTEHFRIIFPESFSSRAGHYATLLEESYTNALMLYPEAKTKIPVIIHNYSMESNGYVVWAPKRMELFPLPGQDNLPLDPARLLTIHEVTHVMQMSSLNKGFTRVMSAFLGEQSVGITSAMVPVWALEGDAVYAETRFSKSGRGRSNAFMQGAKAISLGESGMYSYNKMLLGSYRDFTPDHYVFGYAMMNYLHSTSPDAWKEAIAFTARHPFLINPVNLSLRHNAGTTKKTLFRTTFDTLTAKWGDEEKNISGTDYTILNPDKKGEYENYYSPYCVGEGKFIALKSSLSEPQCFVLIDTLAGKEKKLLTTGYLFPQIFSYANGTIVWSEFQQDPRWNNRNYFIIKTMEISTGSVKQLTRRTRFSSPSFSQDGKNIVAVSTTPDMKTSLVFIDPSTGSITREINAPEGVSLQRPAWAKEGTSIVAVSLTAEGEGILLYDTVQNTWNYLLENSNNDIIKAELTDDSLYVLVQDEKADNIYLKTADEPLKRITNSRFGISSFSVYGNIIFFSDYSSTGFNTCSTSINPLNDFIHLSLNKNVDDANKAVQDSNFTDTVNYSVSPYRKSLHLFKFHSWAPFYFNPDDLQTDALTINPGFTFMSQNDLSTLISTFAYEYSNGYHILHSNIKWQGRYPVIELGMSHGRQNYFTRPSGKSYFSSDIKHISTLDLSVYFPLYFSYGKFNLFFMPAIYLNHLNSYYYPFEYYNYKEDLTIITPRFYFSSMFRKAYRDIYPRWGQIVDIKAEFTPWDSERFQTLKGFKSTFFFPGLMRNHSIMVRAGYESQLPLKKGLFSNINSLPRGYDGMVSAELSVISIDYTHPLFYPDLPAGCLLYLKRIRGSEFFDIASSNGTYDKDSGHYSDSKTTLGSYGAELLADFYLLRFPYEISAGVRAGNKFPNEEFFIGGVFSINVYGSNLGRKR